MESRLIIKTIAWLLALTGALSVIAGIVGFFGSYWLPIIGGFFIFLSGYGLMTTDYEDEIS